MATNNPITRKGFIKNSQGEILLPITRAELVLDKAGMPALHSEDFTAKLPDESKQFAGLPGLITAAEKALLHTLDGGNESGSGTIANIYSDLKTLFDISLSFNGTALKYYDNKTLKDINITNGDGIAVNVDGSNASIGLAPLADKTDDTTINNVVTGITVDKYGRVINVSGSTDLAGLTLAGSKIKENVEYLKSADVKAIASKEYVDFKFNEANATAVGALHFGSVLQNDTQLSTILGALDQHINYYYKLIFEGTLNSAVVLNSEVDVRFRKGDTIIVHKTEGGDLGVVYIPSGDEPITSLGVKDYMNNGLDSTVGDITLSFDAPFIITPLMNNASIGLPVLTTNSAAVSGLLSKNDYDRFCTYADKTVEYLPTVKENSPYCYEIGQLSLSEGTSIPIYGQNTTYALSVTNGYTSGEYITRDPKLVFGPSSGDPSSDDPTAVIQIKGTLGIVVSKDANNNSINITANNTVLGNSTTYLSITDGYQFGVTIGNVNNNDISDGLADFRTMMSYISGLYSTTVKFDVIGNSLSSPNTGDDYFYGSDPLKLAIEFDKTTE